MLIFRDINGFSIQGKYQYVRVEIVTMDGTRWAAIYESKESPCYPTYIQPFNDSELYHFAYKFASMCARYEFHPHG